MHNGLVALGIVLLLIGVGISFYYVSIIHPVLGIEVQRTYPYQTVGAALIIAGVLSIALGVYYSPQKGRAPPSIS